jgi:uncharacterized protein (TIGR00730 family)
VSPELDREWAVCVYCASGPTHPELLSLAVRVGEAIADRGWTLVSGGGNVSAMGALAGAARARGGRTVGVIPKALVHREVADTEADELVVTDTMRERKQVMEDRADAFIALPGGIGTVEELVEALTWTQLGVHDKPCVMLDIEGYWAPLAAFLDHSVTERFLRVEHRSMLMSAATPEEAVAAVESWSAPTVPKWLDRDET